MKTMPSFKIGSSVRPDPATAGTGKDRLSVPDPGAYNPNASFTKSRAASIGFGSSKR